MTDSTGNGEQYAAESDAGGYLAAAWIRDNGTGYFFTCPRCHFYKNADEGPCRRIGCGGTVELVEVRVTSPTKAERPGGAA